MRPALDRVAFADGDLLRADDLNADALREAELHALHVRAVHGTWGVTLGFSVAVEIGGRALAVGPGLAYDLCGRAIASFRTERVPLPRSLGDGDHVLATAVGAPSRWRWVPSGRHPGAAVPLARVTVASGQLDELDTSVRVRADSPVRTRVATGQVVVSSTAARRRRLVVDTTSARFHEVPHYFAQVQDVDVGSAFEDRPLEPLLDIRDERRARFTLDIRRFGRDEERREERRGALRVTWVGVEQRPEETVTEEAG